MVQVQPTANMVYSSVPLSALRLSLQTGVLVAVSRVWAFLPWIIPGALDYARYSTGHLLRSKVIRKAG